MAEIPPSSSQDSHYGRYKLPLDQMNSASSPMRPRSLQKPRKPPTVTPKRFTKFFTPRSTRNILGARQSKAGRQLRDITKNGANRRRLGLAVEDDLLVKSPDELLSIRPTKRRKLSRDLASSPLQSSPLKRVQTTSQIVVFEDEPLSPTVSDLASLPDLLDTLKPYPKAIRRLRAPGPSRRLLERTLGGPDAIYRGQRGPDHVADIRAETANFATTPKDVHHFRGTALPFCTTSCNTNSLIAVGDEEGSVRLMDSSPLSDFGVAHINIRVHHNAIMDVAFSSDDYLLATVSGDQTGRVVDMHTQRTMCILTGHKSSVKQVRFQPNNDNVVTTSSKDGTVMVWDLRAGGKVATQRLRTSSRAPIDSDGNVEIATKYTSSTLNVGYGHRSSNRPFSNHSELSITSIQHLPHGREHLLLTASEVNASIKLWDLRNASRRSDPIPLSSTPLPEPHQRTRNYGVNAMVLSGDGARLYTACRDATVYAYSTNQLALGHVPEMSTSSRRRLLKDAKAGLGPLYGIRHPLLRIGTFYIKAALRPARDDQTELLAVGSSDRSPILFPTDERYYMRRRQGTRNDDHHDDLDNDANELPSFPPKSSQTSTSGSQSPASSPQICETGSALLRAHNKEVTSVAWTHQGELISISDDFTSRCWREDASKARELRGCGEVGGQRWGCGWAEASADWDEEDC